MGARFLNQLATTGAVAPSFGLEIRYRVVIRVAKRGIGCQALFLG
jgi:hypothetical protein